MHVPVWHEKTRELVKNGELQLVGIVQEQHPDRAALYAQWQGFDFPILWDPFGVTGLEVVPVITGVDEHGVVRLPRADPRRFEGDFVQKFMAVDFPGPAAESAAESAAELAGSEGAEPGRASFVASEAALEKDSRGGALARLMGVGAAGAPGVDTQRLLGDTATPYGKYVAGVALRLRHDGALGLPGDFQGAIDLWSAALAERPNQYIWRRRIQQWGPRLDKPYPFYDWIETAVTEVTARGEKPVQVRASLSGSEVAGKSRKLPGARTASAVHGAMPEAAEPDPRGRLLRDDGELVGLDLTVAPHTASAGGSVRSPMGSSRAHITLRPAKGAKWALDADPATIWLDLPEGWNAAATAFRFPAPVEGGEAAALTVDFELSTQPIPLGPPDAMPPPPTSRIPGYAAYSICLEDGTCVFRRQDFVVEVTFPGPPSGGADDADDER